MMQSKKDFLKLFSRYVITFVFPTLLICIGIISFLFAQLAIQIKDSNLNVLEQSKSLIDANMKNIISLSYQVSNNDEINASLIKKNSDVSGKNFNAWKISQEINLYQVSGTLFEKIAIYSKESDMIIEKASAYSTDEYFEKYVNKAKKSEIEKIRKNLESSKSGFLVFEESKSSKTRTSIYYRAIKSNDNVITGSLLAFVSEPAVLKLLDPIDLSDGCSMIIADEDNSIIFQTNNALNVKKQNNSIRVPKGYQMLSMESDILNMKYMYFYIKGALYGKIRHFAFVIIGLFVIAVLLSALLAKRRAGKMNEIIFSVLDENRQMREGVEIQLEEEKKKRFIELLQNNFIQEENSFSQQFNFRYEKIVVMILKQSGYCENDIQIYSEINEETLKRINSIVCENLKNFNISFYAAHYGVSGYVYALNFNSFENVKSCIHEIEQKFLKYNITLHIGVGEIVENFGQLHNSYNSAISAYRYSVSGKSRTIVYYEEIQKYEKGKFYYTSEQETLLIGVIRRGQSEKVVKILDDIFENNFIQRQITFVMSKRLIYNMVLTVYKALDEIYAKDVKKQEHGNQICRNILSNDNIEECFGYIKETLLAICADVNKRNSIDIREGEVKEYIEKHYTDKDLSLSLLAEEMGMNYYTLSRLFNENIGASFVGYLTKVRLEEARKMLKETDMKIEQISEQSGFYSSSTFIKAFKKYYNETPSAYRRNCRE